MSDVEAVEVPSLVAWPANGAPGLFIPIYEWDTVVPYPGVENVLESNIELCTVFYPCSLSIQGAGDDWILLRKGNGSISCIVGSGCTELSITSIRLSCQTTAASTPVLEIQGTMLKTQNSSFESCSTLSDGGLARCFGAGSSITVQSSRFNGTRSQGVGGAISAVGCVVTVANSTFHECHSASSGGAIAGQQFLCYGSADVIVTSITITSSTFDQCSSDGDGGALSVSSDIATLYVEATNFVGCFSYASGGAISGTEQAQVQIYNSWFRDNSALALGGGISVGQSANARIQNTIFDGNYVYGVGGGALYANGASIWLKSVSCMRNKAPYGGGGVIFWDGTQPTTAEHGKVTPYTPAPVCGTGNSALYGQCVASSFSMLEIYGMPNTIYPGLLFPIQVLKKDLYNQTISSDSSSVLQIFTALNSELITDRSVTLSGSIIASFDTGQVSFSAAVKPSYIYVDTINGVTVEASQPTIYLKGIDAQTDGNMVSSTVRLPMSSNWKICPAGYILVLDNEHGNATGRPGSCSLCAQGTYSVSPLVGSTPSTPSCLTCPSSAVCMGGSDVNFTLGRWIIANGMYVLVGCPAGHQLINSLNGAFSQVAQDCKQCSADSYILDHNNASYSCQPCPVGASCDGNSLSGLVAGSVWIADWRAGIYVLQSCPAGYELLADTIDSQQCQLCAQSYYCLGGKSASAACPGQTYAPPGSNTSADCIPAVFVQMVVILPVNSVQFTTTEQSEFQQALASAAGVSSGFVVILGFTPTSRRSSSSSIQVKLAF